MAGKHRRAQRRRALPAALAALATTLALVAAPALLGAAHSAFGATTVNPGNRLVADRLQPPSAFSVTQSCTGVRSIAVRGTPTTATGSTSLVLTPPSEVLTNDLLVVQVVHGDTTVGVTPPTGWQTLRTETSDGLVASALFWKLAVTGEPTAGFSRPPTAGGDMVGGMVAYSGVDTSNPVAVSDVRTGTGTTATTPAPSTTAVDVLAVRFLAKAYEDLPVAGGTQRWKLMTGTRADAQGMSASDEAVPGPGPVPTRTSTSGTNTSSPWIAQTVVLRHDPGTVGAVLSWTATPSAWADGYRGARQVGTAAPLTRTAPMGTTSTTDSPLTNGTTYTYRLWAYRSTWTSAVLSATLTPNC